MNRLEINPNNEKYYSKEFMQGYKCGTKSQFDADVKVLDKIRQEIEEKAEWYNKNLLHEHADLCNEILQIIDKYR